MSLLTVIPVLRRQEERPALFFALLLLLGPILSVIGIAALFDKAGLITHPRFVFPAIVGLCLILGRAMMSSCQRVLPILVAFTVFAFFLHFQVKWVQLNRNPFTPWYFYGNISLAVAEVNERRSRMSYYSLTMECYSYFGTSIKSPISRSSWWAEKDSPSISRWILT